MSEITKIEFSIAGFCEGSNSFEITKNKNGVRVKLTPNPLKNDEEEKIVYITTTEYENIINTLYCKCHINTWKSEYYSPIAMDGIVWNLTITDSEKSKIKIHGMNDYPPEFKTMLDILQKLFLDNNLTPTEYEL